MSFNIPHVVDLIERSKTLEAVYKEERLSMDNNRFLASFRGNTDNPVRKADIKFIATLGGSIEKNNNDVAFERLFTQAYPSQDKYAFLQRALAGAFLFHFSKINDGYLSETSVKDRSALAKSTCNLFGVEKFSEIPQEELESCLQALQSYLKFVMRTGALKLKWHESKTNRALVREIEEEMTLLNIPSQATISR